MTFAAHLTADHGPLLPHQREGLGARLQAVELLACQRRVAIHGYQDRLARAHTAGAAMRRALRRVQSTAGHPDPVEACRLILAIAAQALADEKAARLA